MNSLFGRQPLCRLANPGIESVSLLLQSTGMGDSGLWTRDHKAASIEFGHPRSDIKTGLCYVGSPSAT
jgi:hypothetical protein